jgi:hypothetical protein
MPFKRLKARLVGQPLVGDVATCDRDWEPVPASEVACPDEPLAWLQEELKAAPKPPPLPLDMEGDAIPPIPLHPVLRLTPVEQDPSPPEPSYLDHFSPEELAVIEEQKRKAAAPAPEPPRAEPAPVAKTAKPEPKPERHRWVDVLRTIGEHLTEAELKVIRQQLAST